ncbi:MAG: CotH kinase family protein [Bacteroidota bacterium]
MKSIPSRPVIFLLNTTVFTLAFVLVSFFSPAQVIINEGCNKNYSLIQDTNEDYPDWIELYNAGTDTVNLFNYSLSDNINEPAQWTFPEVLLLPGQYMTVLCSGKDRKPHSPYINVLYDTSFTPSAGWNTFQFTTPFYWDGFSSLIINICCKKSLTYTWNCVFNQTATSYVSSLYHRSYNSDWVCNAGTGRYHKQRPNMKLNGMQIGFDSIRNATNGFPAPFGNLYTTTRSQFIIPGPELTASGLTSGYIDSLSFDVDSANILQFDYIDFCLQSVEFDELTTKFVKATDKITFHTNFKISASGETVYLFDPSQNVISSLVVDGMQADHSVGHVPDNSGNIEIMAVPTPDSTNNFSQIWNGYLAEPLFSLTSGVYTNPVSVSIGNMSGGTSVIRYTTDGSDPDDSSAIYNGTPLNFDSTVVLKAACFDTLYLRSKITAASYLFDISHTTPVISIITADSNLYGPLGIFDNWAREWSRPAYVDYFDSTGQVIFSQRAGIKIDGGAGGSRRKPQHSMRVMMGDGTLGDGTVYYNFIPNRGARNKYSDFYLRNGSNMYLRFPHKDAAETQMTTGAIKGYYSSWRPVTVYINGGYFGLYELREKFNAEYFETLEGADSISLLTMSYWNGQWLRPLEGSEFEYFDAYEKFCVLDPSDNGYWASADSLFDLEYYTDYIISQSWIGNSDWPDNNIKLYRSNKTGFRWRFCVIDQEWAMNPYGWNDCTFNSINFMNNVDTSWTYLNMWKKSMQNGKFKNYFINRYADVMNTAYRYERLEEIENTMFYLVQDEMDDQFMRWKDTLDYDSLLLAYYFNHFTFLSQLEQRSDYVRDDILFHYSLPNLVDLTLDVVPQGAGKIHISTIKPENYPWNGIYFNGVPIKIEAIANPGYTFSHWQNNSLITDTLSVIFEDTLNAQITSFTAHFNPVITDVEANEAPLFSVWPNPANSILFIAPVNPVTEARWLEVNDVLGNRIFSNEPVVHSGRIVVDVSSLPSSVYLVTIYDKNGLKQTCRIVKTASDR